MTEEQVDYFTEGDDGIIGTNDLLFFQELKNTAMMLGMTMTNQINNGLEGA